MKKIIAFLFCSLLIATTCFANSYDNNPNYRYVYATKGIKAFLDLISVKVHKYEPPIYEIAGHFVYVSDYDGNVSRTNSIIAKYNYSTKDIWIWNGYWEIADKREKTSIDIYNRSSAKAMFRAAYNMDFE